MTQAQFQLENASVYWVSLIKDPPRRMQLSRNFALFDPLMAKLELTPEVKINAEYFFTHNAPFSFSIFER